MKELYEYLDKEISGGRTDFCFRAVPNGKRIDIGIYPDSADGETIDISLSKTGDEKELSIRHQSDQTECRQLKDEIINHCVWAEDLKTDKPIVKETE